MGLYIQSLENIPSTVEREYYIYLLDYGWTEPLGEALMQNYEKMASLASDTNAVVIRGTNRVHFEDQVLSWHNINGENADEILPAILITNRHPSKFKESFSSREKENIENDLKLILIPLKKFCKTTTEVIQIIEKVFGDIKENKDLYDFKISKEVNKNFGRALVDAIILEPNISGIGFSFNKMANYFRKK